MAVHRAWPGDTSGGFELVSPIVDESPISNVLQNAVVFQGNGPDARHV